MDTKRHFTPQEIADLNLDHLRRIAIDNSDPEIVEQAMQRLINEAHYTTHLDKYLTYNAPYWLTKFNDDEFYEDPNCEREINGKKALAMHGIGLPILAEDENEFVRSAVAYAGYNPEMMINDPSPYVRAALVYNNFRIDDLTKDPSELVRAQVALNKHNLEILANDPSPVVRSAVASVHSHLKKLVSDPSAMVREEVANARYGLNLLIRDPNPQVRMSAAMAQIRINAEKANEEVLESKDDCMRKALAISGFFHKELAKDPCSDVRAFVALSGNELDVLINDPEATVRIAVANTGYGTDHLAKDECVDVRIRLALNGYKPYKMCEDPSPMVRATVAMLGYETDILEADPNKEVAKIARSIANGDYRKAHVMYISLMRNSNANTNIIPEI